MFGAGVEVLGLHQGNRALVVLCYSCGHVNIDVEVEKQFVQESLFPCGFIDGYQFCPVPGVS